MRKRGLLPGFGALLAAAALVLAAERPAGAPAEAPAETPAEAPAEQAEPARSTYTDASYGFTIRAPAFPKAPKGTGAMVVTMMAPPENMFASNVNVMVQNVSMKREAYRDLSRGQFKAMGYNVHTERELEVSGRDAVLWDYEGKVGGRELRWLTLAVMDKERVCLVTCTGLKDGFEKYEKEFRACLDSFRLAGGEAAPAQEAEAAE